MPPLLPPPSPLFKNYYSSIAPEDPPSPPPPPPPPMPDPRYSRRSPQETMFDAMRAEFTRMEEMDRFMKDLEDKEKKIYEDFRKNRFSQTKSRAHRQHPSNGFPEHSSQDSHWGNNHRAPSSSRPTVTPPPPHYQLLGISFDATAAEIEKAAKEKRVATHPDRLKRKGGLTDAQMVEIDELAKRVGCAADVLMDPGKKAVYDLNFLVWY